MLEPLKYVIIIHKIQPLLLYQEYKKYDVHDLVFNRKLNIYSSVWAEAKHAG